MTNTSIDTFVSIECIIVHIVKIIVCCCGWICSIIVRGGKSAFLVCRIRVGILIAVGVMITLMIVIICYFTEDTYFIAEEYDCVIVESDIFN